MMVWCYVYAIVPRMILWSYGLIFSKPNVSTAAEFKSNVI